MNKAFTLVELAIVLIIIGLITGGVVGAQSLINSAKINSLGAEMERIRGAYTFFKFEYDGLPGDFTEAEDYWPNSNTENGDGDKIIEGNGWFAGSSSNESFCFWSHLYNSEILPYKDVDCSLEPPCCAPTEDSTATSEAFDNIFFMFSTQFAPDTTKGYLALIEKGHSNTGKGLLVRDLYKLDKKFDDGLRTSGFLVADSNGFIGDTGSSSVCGNGGNLNNYIINRTDSNIISCRYQRFYLDYIVPKQI